MDLQGKSCSTGNHDKLARHLDIMCLEITHLHTILSIAGKTALFPDSKKLCSQYSYSLKNEYCTYMYIKYLRVSLSCSQLAVERVVE